MRRKGFKLLFPILALLFVAGCSSNKTINLKVHSFNASPKRIIWFQIPGLNEEQLALLKFRSKSTTDTTALEKFTCHGKAWSFNLYDLRPEIGRSFLAQITGSPNMKGTCEDYQNAPFWNLIKTADQNTFQLGVLEKDVSSEQSLLNGIKCKSNFLSKRSTLWLMATREKKEDIFFHYLESKNFESGKVYYDKSCQKNKGKCFTSFSNNFSNIFEKFSNTEEPIAFIVRNFSYYKALKLKRISQARDELIEIEKALLEVIDYQKRFKDTLVLVTSAAPLLFEFPQEGKDWKKFEKTGSGLVFHRESLISPVWALGSRAENFCGMYSESGVHRRILWKYGSNIFNKFFSKD